MGVVKCPKCGSDTTVRKFGQCIYARCCIQPSCNGRVKMSLKESNEFHNRGQELQKSNRQTQSSHVMAECKKYYEAHVLNRKCPQCGERMCMGKDSEWNPKHYFAICPDRSCQHQYEISKKEAKKTTYTGKSDDSWIWWVVVAAAVIMIAAAGGWFGATGGNSGGGGGGCIPTGCSSDHPWLCNDGGCWAHPSDYDTYYGVLEHNCRKCP